MSWVAPSVVHKTCYFITIFLPLSLSCTIWNPFTAVGSIISQPSVSETHEIILFALPMANGLCRELVHLLCFDHNDCRPGLISCICSVAQQILWRTLDQSVQEDHIDITSQATTQTTQQYITALVYILFMCNPSYFLYKLAVMLYFESMSTLQTISN